MLDDEPCTLTIRRARNDVHDIYVTDPGHVEVPAARIAHSSSVYRTRIAS